MSVEWSIDSVRFSAAPRNPGRVVIWAVLPLLAATLVIGAVALLMLTPDPFFDVDRCERWSTYEEQCHTLRPTLDGQPWPDRFDWQNGRLLQLKAGHPPYFPDPDRPADDPDNAAFLAMAAQVVSNDSHTAWRITDAAINTQAREEAWALEKIRDQLYADNIEAARVTRILDREGIEDAARIRSAAGVTTLVLLVVLGGLAGRSAIRRLRDLRATALEITAHQVEWNGQTIPRHAISRLELEGRRLVLWTKDGKRLQTSPIPTDLIDDADILREAFQALDPAAGPEGVPDALAALRSRRGRA